MVWQQLIDRLSGLNASAGTPVVAPSRQNRRRSLQRALRLESMERRQLMAMDMATVSGVAFIDQANDGLTVDDPPILVDSVTGDLVAPGTAGATGIVVQLFLDDDGTNTGVPGDGVFSNDANGSGPDQLIGTATSDVTTGAYEFTDLTAGTYFLVQKGLNASGANSTVDELVNSSPVTITISPAQAMGNQLQLIDDYSQTDQTLTVTAGNTDNSIANTAAGETIGGERDIIVDHSGTASVIVVNVDATNDSVTFGSNGVGASGTATLQYDGDDGLQTLDTAVGLGNVSLTGNSPGDPIDPNAGFIVETSSQLAGDTVDVIVYSDGGTSSIATVTVPVSATNVEQFVPFSAFIGDADLNAVRAIEAVVSVTELNDIDISVVETREQTVIVQNLDNFQQLSLGGTVFLDTFSGSPNDGVQQGIEAGVPGVLLEIYELTGPSATVDLDNVGVTPLTTTTSGAGGDYIFNSLDPGFYVVVIPDGQFSGAAPLAGFGNSTATSTIEDEDAVDDGATVPNAIVMTGATSAAISSNVMTLTTGGEPIDDDDSDPNTNTTVDFGFFPQIDLSISKLVNAASGNNEDGQAVFDINVTNLGPLAATGVEVTDAIPSGLSFNSIAGAPAGVTASDDGSVVTVDVGDVDVGIPNSVTFQLIFDIADNQTDDIDNTVVVATDDQIDIDDTNNSSTATLDMVSTPLTITKTDSEDPVDAGGTFEYVITVTNDSTTDTASGVQVTDLLPAGVTFDSTSFVTLPDGSDNPNLVTQDGGDPQLITATIGTLAPGASASVTLVVDVAGDAATQVSNTATVTASPNTIPVGTDVDDEETTDVTQRVDIEIDKSISTTAPVAGGDAFTYTVTVTNNGPSDAENVAVVDDLDDLLSLVNGSFVVSSGSATLTPDPTDDTLLNFDIGTLAPGPAMAVTFSFDVTLAASASGDLINTAVASTTSPEDTADLANNTDTETVTISRDVDLAITKTVVTTVDPTNGLTATPGNNDGSSSQLQYTITVTNNGNSDAEGVFVADDLSDDLNSGRITNITVDAGSFTVTNSVDNDTPNVDFGTIPAGENRSFTITTDIPAAATGTIVNNAVVDSDDTAALTSNDVTTNLVPAFDLVVDKTVDGTDQIAPDGVVTFELVISHDTVGTEVSPSDATGVVVTDTLPDGLTFQSATSGGAAVTLTPVANGTATDLVFPAFDLPAGTTRTLTVVATADTTGDGLLTNSTSFVTDAGETDTTNNSDDAEVTIVPTVNLTIEKLGPSVGQVGQQLTYTITVDNAGPSAATGVEVIDTLPSGLTFVSGVGPAGEALSAAGQVVTVPLTGSLASGTDFSFTIVAEVAAAATGNLTNTAVVSTDTNETSTTDNTATSVTQVDPIDGSIAGVVYIDADNDGIVDPGEQRLAGVTITLSGTDSLGNAVNRTVQTDVNGIYEFEDLPAGTYVVTQTQPAGLTSGTSSPGTGALSSAAADNVFSNLGLDISGDAQDFNFGELSASLSKRRFLASS